MYLTAVENVISNPVESVFANFVPATFTVAVSVVEPAPYVELLL